MKKRLFFLVAILIGINLSAQVSKTVDCTAGSLSSLISSSEKDKITDLVISGSINATDLFYIRGNMFNLSSLDLTNATIDSYTDIQGVSYQANEFPQGSLTNRSNLTTVKLPKTVTIIGKNAFEGCYKLKSVLLPEFLLEIGRNCFKNCRLGTIEFPETLKKIGNGAFISNSFAEISIPINMEMIGDSAFYNCMNLTQCSFLSNSCEIGQSVFELCWSLTICNLPERIKVLPSKLFKNCSELETCLLPESVTTIHSECFSRCSSLKLSNLPNNLEQIGERTFADCNGVTFQTLPSSVKTIGAEAFRNCTKITLTTLPETIKRIENYTFENCIGIVNFTIPSSVSYVGSSAFAGLKNLLSITLPSSITYIGEYAFYQCKGLTFIELPPIRILKSSTFSECYNLLTIRLPESLTKIESQAFNDCLKLTSIIIPENVTEIGDQVFEGCDKMKEIKIMRFTSPKTGYIYNNEWTYQLQQCKLIVPFGARSNYRAVESWKYIKVIEEMDGFSLNLGFIQFNANSGIDSTIQINSNVEWNAYSDQPWIEIIPKTRNNNERLCFTYSANPTPERRKARIIIKAFGIKSQELVVEQAPCIRKIELSLNSDTIIMNPEQVGYEAIKVKSNTEWVVTSDQKWLTFLPDSTVMGDSTIRISTSINNTTTYRVAHLQITGSKINSRTITILQKGKIINKQLSAFPTNDSLSSGGGITKFRIFSNVRWQAKTDNNWLRITPDSTITGDTILQVTVSENKDLYNRSGFISLNAEGVSQQFIRIEQEGCGEFLKVPFSEYNFEKGADTSIIAIEANTYWYANSNQPWLIVNPTNNQNGDKLTITVKENNTLLTRYATISINPYSSTSKTIYVRQSGIINRKRVSIKAGELNQAISKEERLNINSLEIYGEMDARDFKTLRDSLPYLEELDISDIHIKSYIGPFGTDGTFNEHYPEYSIPQNAFYKGYNSNSIPLRSIKLPTVIFSIGNEAFRNCRNLATITIPIPVTRIEDYAFNNCLMLTSINLPTTLQSIGESAFSNCTRLRNIELPLSLLTIESDVFSGCAALESIEIPTSVINLGTSIFDSCRKLRTVNILSPILVLPSRTFIECTQLKECLLPETLIEIGEESFSGCSSMESITIPGSTKMIDNSAFYSCSGLIAIVIPGSVTYLGENVFYDCRSLLSAEIPSSINNIPQSTFYNCQQLLSVIIPSTVTDINSYAFNNCYNMTSIITDNPIPVDLSAVSSVFGVNKNKCILYVPYGSKPLYQQASQWKDFINIKETSNLVLSADAIKFSSTARCSTTVDITSSSDWIARCDQSWITLTPSQGTKENRTITITAEAAPNSDYRSTEIIFSSTEVESRILNVIQSQGAPILEVSASQVAIGKEIRSEATVNVTSNTQWKISSNETWLMVQSDSIYNGNGIVEMIADLNPTILAREARVTLSSITGGLSQTILVTQPAGDSYFRFSTNSISIPKNGNRQIDVQLYSNTNWGLIKGDFWITTDLSKGSGNATITYFIAENKQKWSRSGNMIYSGEGAENQQVNFYQSLINDTISVSDSVLLLSDLDNSSVTINVYSPGDWSAFTDQDWLSFTSNNYSGDGILSISAKENDELTSRVGFITVKSNSGFSKKITIVQTGGTPRLTVYPLEVPLSNVSNSTAIIKVYSNCNWQAESNQNWLMIQSSSVSDKDGELVLSASENNSSTDRIAEVTIRSVSGDLSQKITVVQVSKAILEVSATELKVPKTANSQSIVNITSNILWSATSNCLWLSLDQASGKRNGTVTISAEENPTISERSGEVIIKGQGVAERKIVITQEAGDVILKLNVNYFNTGDEFGYSSSVRITTNSPWTASTENPWITIKNSSGIGNDTIHFSFPDNNTSNERYGYIWITANGGKKEVINIRQESSVPYLNVFADSIILEKEEGSLSSFLITTNRPWKIKNIPSWISVVPDSGNANEMVVVKARVNAGTIRKTTLLIEGNESGTKNVQIIQGGSPAYLNISEQNISIPSESDSFERKIVLNSNSNWKVLSNQSWLKISLTSILDSLKDYGDLKTIKFNLSGEIDEDFIINPSSTYPTISKSNTLYNQPQWSDSISGTGQDTLIVAADINPTIYQREGSLTILGDGLEPQNIFIIQSAGDTILEVSLDEIHFSSGINEDALAEVFSNTDWNVTSDCDWLIINKLTGNGNETLHFNVLANSNNNNRTASVTINAIGCEPKTITIHQEGKVGKTILPKKIISVFPNPFINGFSIQGAANNSKIVLYNLNGERVYSTDAYSGEFIRLDQLSSGEYFLIIDNQGYKEIKKLLKIDHCELVR
jgi:hypothetical protein